MDSRGKGPVIRKAFPWRFITLHDGHSHTRVVLNADFRYTKSYCWIVTDVSTELHGDHTRQLNGNKSNRTEHNNVGGVQNEYFYTRITINLTMQWTFISFYLILDTRRRWHISCEFHANDSKKEYSWYVKIGPTAWIRENIKQGMMYSISVWIYLNSSIGMLFSIQSDQTLLRKRRSFWFSRQVNKTDM